MKIQLCSALERDLGRDVFVTELIDVSPALFEIKHCIENIHKVGIIIFKTVIVRKRC